MTREEAIQRFNGIINAMSISVAQAKFYPSKAELNELCDMAIEALQADRPHGEWIGLNECSVCGKQVIDFIDGWVDGLEYLPNFCPNCGADMRKENK